jgi:hypothetical protein
MKPDGRVVLILGGKLGCGGGKAQRSLQYPQKQGAGFPIDMMVVEGRGKSACLLPAAEVPRIYRTFEELGGYLDDVVRNKSQYLGTNGRRTPDFVVLVKKRCVTLVKLITTL